MMMPVLKKYRSSYYDAFDSKYAKNLSEIYHSCHNEGTREKFNSFSENLMDETAICRNGLLDAMDEYERTEDSIEFPLDVRFLNAAWNYRAMGF